MGTCETKTYFYGNKPRVSMYYWKRIHLGLVKIWLGYEIYNLVDEKERTLIKDEKGKTIYGKNLEQIEIKWIWKKR